MLERILTYTDESSSSEVLVRISYPEKQTGDYACAVEVKGGPFDVTTKIFGLDSMQAIVLAISFARRILTESEAHQRSQLYWIAPDRDLGLL